MRQPIGAHIEIHCGGFVSAVHRYIHPRLRPQSVPSFDPQLPSSLSSSLISSLLSPHRNFASYESSISIVYDYIYIHVPFHVSICAVHSEVTFRPGVQDHDGQVVLLVSKVGHGAPYSVVLSRGQGAKGLNQSILLFCQGGDKNAIMLIHSSLSRRSVNVTSEVWIGG